MKSTIRTAAVLLLISSFMALTVNAAVHEQRLGTLPPEYFTLTRLQQSVSADGLHLTVITKHGGKSAVFCDGKEGRDYDEIAGGYVMFSPDGKRMAYVARDSGKSFMVVDEREGPRSDQILVGGPVFSPNGEHVAYVAQNGEHRLVVFDGKAGPAYDSISNEWVNFSDDGKHYGYVARTSGKFVAVVDGKETLNYDGDDLIGTVFSRDGRDAGYSARQNGKWTVLIDGRPGGPEFNHVYGPYFSADGKRFAYVGQNSNSFALVVDGKAGPAYAEATAASPFGAGKDNLVVYWAAKGPALPSDKLKEFIVVNGKEGPEYDGVNQPITSPDGKHLAYTVTYGHFDVGSKLPNTTAVVRQAMILDGVEGIKYAAIFEPIFSPDSRHLAYVACDPIGWGHFRLVLDGKEGPQYERVNEFPSSVVFSPDSQRVGYVAWKGTNRIVVVDEKEGRLYDSGGTNPDTLWHTYSLGFSPDSRHFAYYAQKGAKWVVVIDKTDGPEYDDILRSTAYGAAPKFIAHGTVEYLAVRGNELYRVVASIEDGK